jgi:hypothetical protein
MAAKLKIEKRGMKLKKYILGQRAGPPHTILEEDHPMTIISKFGSN